jgi:hypothetical protein
MKTLTHNPPNANDSLTTPAETPDRRHGPTPLGERELEMVAAAGGRGGLSGDFRL